MRRWGQHGARLVGALLLLAALAGGAWRVLPAGEDTDPVARGKRAGQGAGSGAEPGAGSPEIGAPGAAPAEGDGAKKRARAARAQGAPPPTLPATGAPPPPPVDESGEVLLASSFDRPVCGRYYNASQGCEFAVQGEVETGPFGGRSGEGAVRIDRTSPDHMGVVTDLPLPEGHAFVGAAHRVPALPDGVIKPRPGHIQLMQLSPTDGEIPGHAVEVRLFPDRRLGLGLNQDPATAMLDWAVPVDEWFYVVVELANGPAATQRLWVYDSADRLQGGVSTVLDTTQGGRRTAQKIGGSTPTTSAMYTLADDWYISTTYRGPAHVGPDGTFLDG